MFASQLLRILQTIPSHEASSVAFDQDARTTISKGSQDVAFYISESFEGSSRKVFDEKPIKDNWDYNDYDSSRIRNCSKEENQIQKGILCHVYCEDEDSDSSSTKAKDEDSVSMAVESIRCNGNESQTAGHRRVLTSHLIDLHSNSFTDKTRYDFDLPELMVSYKEPNHQENASNEHERMSGEENMLIEYSNHAHSCITSIQLDGHKCNCEAAEDVLEQESFTPPILLSATSSGNLNGVAVDECGIEEESMIKSFTQGSHIAISESSLEDTSKECDPENSVQTNESSSTRKISSDDMEEESFVLRTLPIEAFGTRSFLRSFIRYLDFEENNLVQSSNKQISFDSAESKCNATTSFEAEGKEDLHTTYILYSSTVESKTITFDFHSPCLVKASNTNEITQDAKSGSKEFKDDLDPNDSHSEKISYTRPDQCSILKLCNLEIVQDHSDNTSSDNSIKFFVTSPIHPISRVNRRMEIALDQKDRLFSGHSSDDQGQSASSKSEGSPDNDDQQVELIFRKHARVNSTSTSVLSPMRYDEGEMSFSAADLTCYSGSVLYSGSLSIRSDGSGTSTTSFAFPILPNEWRSTVRLESADARTLQKHKDWKSGLFCCRC